MGMCSDGRKRDNGGRLGKGMEGCTSGKTLLEKKTITKFGYFTNKTFLCEN